MPPNKQQNNVNNSFSKIFSDIDALINSAAKREDVEAVFKALIEAMKKVETRLTQAISSHKETFKTELEGVRGDIRDTEERVKSLLGSFDAKNADSLKVAVEQLKKNVEEVRALIPELPDYSDRFSEIESKIPQLPPEKLGEDYRNALEALPDEDKLAIEAIKGLPEALKEQDNRITQRAGGGVTNVRIIQAFKSILKTEEPVGAINGVNTQYTVSQPIFAVLSMTLNGETIAQLPNYTVAGNKITFSSALPAAYSGKDFEVKYI